MRNTFANTYHNDGVPPLIPGLYAETGAWSNSGLSGYNNTNTRYGAASSATATWTPTPTPTSGYYQVSFYRVSHAVSQASATLTIAHNGLNDSQSIDLTTGPAGLVDLGIFQFNGAGNEFLRLSQITAGTLRADAVRFTKVAGP